MPQQNIILFGFLLSFVVLVGIGCFQRCRREGQPPFGPTLLAVLSAIAFIWLAVTPGEFPEAGPKPIDTLTIWTGAAEFGLRAFVIVSGIMLLLERNLQPLALSINPKRGTKRIPPGWIVACAALTSIMKMSIYVYACLSINAVIRSAYAL